MRLRRFAVRSTAAVFSLLIASSASAQQQPQARDTADALGRLLRENRMEMRMVSGALEGPGADFLVREGRAAGFFLLGEDHGVAEVPEVAGALFRALAPAGYRHLAIETSPLMARTVEALVRAGGPDTVFRHARAVFAHPLELPFYSWREEGRLLHDVARATPGGADVLWGVDQEFIFSSQMVARWLEARAGTDAARAAAADFRARADSGARAALAGRQGELLVVKADSAFYAGVRAAFAGDAEALDALGQMELSGRIYNLLFAGRNYESNDTREQLIRRNLLEHLRRADARPGGAGKVMVKMGASHLPRGQKLLTNDFSTGNFLYELATARGTHSFHVMVVGGKGTKVATASPAGFGTGPSAGDSPRLAPLVAEALPEGWTVFDLRPLRPAHSSGRIRLEEPLRRVVYGYDALVILTGSTPAES